MDEASYVYTQFDKNEIVREVQRRFVEHVSSHPFDSMLRDTTQEAVVRWAAARALDLLDQEMKSADNRVIALNKLCSEAEQKMYSSRLYAKAAESRVEELEYSNRVLTTVVHAAICKDDTHDRMCPHHEAYKEALWASRST